MKLHAYLTLIPFFYTVELEALSPSAGQAGWAGRNQQPTGSISNPDMVDNLRRDPRLFGKARVITLGESLEGQVRRMVLKSNARITLATHLQHKDMT